MIDLPEESRIIDQIENDAIEKEVFEGLLNGDSLLINQRKYFTVEFMEKWSKELAERSIIL